MKNIFSTNKIISGIILSTFVTFILFAQLNGITGTTAATGGEGCTCHSNTPSSAVTVAINGPSEMDINTTSNFTVTISGGPLVKGGTNIAVTGGGSLTPGEGLRKSGSELTHVEPKLPASGTVTFPFQYTAPASPGTVTIFANGNSVNGNNASTGDQWNKAPNKVITITNPTSVDDNILISNYNLDQNYPNPFNPITTISFALPESGYTELKVYDINGNEAAELIKEFKNAGNHSVVFNASELSSGVYFYTIKVNNFTATKRMVLVK